MARISRRGPATAAAVIAALLAACGGPAQVDPQSDGGPGDLIDASKPGDPDAPRPVDASIEDAPAPDAPPPDAPPDPVPLSLTDVEPQMGPPAGGNLVKVRGGGFTPGATAELAGAPLAGVAVTSASEIQGAAPAGAGFAAATVRLGAATATVPRAYYQGDWQQTGPVGAAINDLLSIGTTVLFAATPAGVYRSTDRGASWTYASTGLTKPTTSELAVDPTNPSRIFAATAGGVFVTANAGLLWTQAGPLALAARAIAIAPSNPAVLYTAAGSALYRSTNGGSSWALVLGESIRDVAIAPGNPSLVLAVSLYGVHRSADGGMTWALANTGLSTPPFSPSLGAVAFDPAQGSVAYVAGSSGVFRSTDGGASWVVAGPTPPFLSLSNLTIHPTSGRIYCSSGTAILMSQNAGASWSTISAAPVPDEGGYITAIALRTGTASELYAGVRGWGAYRTTNGGAAWADITQGIHASEVPAIAPSPAAPGTVFAVLRGNTVWKSTDHGKTWAMSAQGLPTRPEFVLLAVHPTNPDLLLAGSYFETYRSTDGGQTWTDPFGPSDPSMSGYFFDPANPTHAYAVGSDGIHRSTTSGQSWSTVLASDATSIARSGSSLLALTEVGLRRSTDNGVTWAPYGAGLPSSARRLHVDPQQPARIYASGPDDNLVHRSLDGGATWSLLLDAGSDVLSLALDPARPETIYLVTEDGASVQRSLTGLATRALFDRGVPAGSGGTVAVDPTGGVVYLGTLTRGLFRIGD